MDKDRSQRDRGNDREHHEHIFHQVEGGASCAVLERVDRFLSYLEAESAQQQHINEAAFTLRQANQRSKQAIDRIKEAITNTNNES